MYIVNEIQSLKCIADNGTFLLSFRENVTTPISWNATLSQFANHLEDLFTLVLRHLLSLLLSSLCCINIMRHS